MHKSSAMLIEQIIASPGKLSILHAPAGFGKTMLLNQLREELARRGAEVVGTFDRRSNDAPSPWIILDEPDANGVGTMLAGALDAPGGSGGGVVVATRHIDALPVARLRAQGRAIRYGPHQIGISARDAATLMRNAIDKRHADWLAAMIEGWAVAVGFLIDYAAMPNARFDPDGHFLAASGLSDYIDQELLGTLPAEWATALRYASIVASCDQAMLDEIRPEDDLGRHLTSLHHHLPGLVEDRDGRTWLNPLLRLHLSRQFEQLPRAVRADALERAALSCARAGMVPEAASLVTRVGDPGAIVDFIRRSQGLRIWVTAGFDVIREIVAKAGTRGVEDEPRLKLLKCMVHIKDGEIGDGERLLAEVLPSLTGDEQALQDADVVRTALLIYGCRPFTDDQLARFRRYILRNNDDPAWKVLILSMQCILSVQRGDLDEAATFIVDARKQSHLAGSDYGLLFFDIHAINALLARGDLQRARVLLGNARKEWRQKFAKDVGVQTIVDALTASLEFEAGRLSSARVHLRRSTHNMPHVEAWLDIYAAAYEPMARLLALDIGLLATLVSLKAQRDALDASGLPRVARMVETLEICLRGEAALRGKPVDERLVMPDPAERAPSLSWQEREFSAMAEAYKHLSDGDPRYAVEALRGLVDFAEERGISRSVLRAKLLMVAALDRTGDAEGADRIFAEALALGERTGMSRAFAEIGGEAVWRRIMDPITTLASEGAADPGKTKLLRTISRWDDAAPSARKTHFTLRETDVLTALEQGGVDKQIGRRLGITEHAVRYHLKNIYKKLGVHDRVGALSRARDAGVLN